MQSALTTNPSPPPPRYYATDQVLQVFHKTYGNGYVRLQYAASLDELYGYIVGFVVFVGTLKFIKLLRFNKRMGQFGGFAVFSISVYSYHYCFFFFYYIYY